MKVLFVLVILVLIALVIWLIAKASTLKSQNKWKPDLVKAQDARFENLVVVSKGRKQIEVAEIPSAELVGDLERHAELEIAMDEAKALAKDLNKK